eukprot:gene31217-6366_t
MARKKVREHDAKRILKARFNALFAGVDLPIQVAQVTNETDYSALLQKSPWLGDTKLVVKPDMLFGQRGKNDLVGLNLSYAEAQSFIKERLNKVVTINGCTGAITHFVVEPFVPHDKEYYVSINSNRLDYEISFSEAGGVDLEDWPMLVLAGVLGQVDALQAVTGEVVAPLIASFPLELKPLLEQFICNVFKVFVDIDATMLEMNPFTIDPRSGRPFPLDIRLELDDTARFRSAPKWGEAEFPLPFGRDMTAAEEYVHSLDEATGASLKFTVLNPKGRVWLMVAGGGASVIYTDTVGDLGYSPELGNYGEYSGAPNTNETYLADGRPRALLIGGGIANFTDVAATFKGIISALKERSEALKAAKVNIFVRRGGPNYDKGLELMRAVGVEIDIPIKVSVAG